MKPITFLSDYGYEDEFAGVCRAVIERIAPGATVLDISHGIAPQDVRRGAFALAAAVPYGPAGVHLAVVDPGVGTERRPVAIRAGRGDILIGPDNGLLPPAADALGGAIEARELTNRDLWLPVTTSTFHGRDIFSPVAAHLAAGDAEFDAVGPAIPLADLVRLPEPEASVREGVLETVVTYIDSFGNLRLAGGQTDLDGAFGTLTDGDALLAEFGASADGAPVREPTKYGTTFGSVPSGASLLYVDSLGNLAMADNQGSLAARLGIGHDRPLRITRA